MMNSVELIGCIASMLIVVSMVFKTSTYKGTIAMRSINAIGSIVFLIYGLILPAYATAIANGALIVINCCHIVKEYKDHKKDLAKSTKNFSTNN